MSEFATMTLARALQREADGIVPKFHATGNVDLEAVARMEKLRHEIITADAQSPMDALMQFGCVRSVAGFLLGVARGDQEDPEATMALIECGLLEILIGLDAMRPKLEAEAGASLQELGLFQDRGNLQ